MKKPRRTKTPKKRPPKYSVRMDRAEDRVMVAEVIKELGVNFNEFAAAAIREKARPIHERIKKRREAQSR